MADPKTYDVHRSMLGGDGKEYHPGDTRELLEVDAVDLVESGALSLEGEEPKVRAPAVRNTFGQAEPTGHLSLAAATTDDAVRAARKKAQPIAAPIEAPKA